MPKITSTRNTTPRRSLEKHIHKLCLIPYLIVAFSLGACRDSRGPDTKHETPIICTQCNARATLSLPSFAKDETWPKECPTCKKLAAYACGTCANCGAPVPLKDAQSGKYGRPNLCPQCNLRWKK